ncbi:hypothetical protein ILUMI_05723 [Ignelater luminosus]|uniref:Uncharacterized protein n=1 Tax=Ignelater luminosus TaxID=2038154 RepID=A0A8K0DBR2_IGNLU|nr:hypothetical protein ILUMI_14829 [Ignelater luminosus]KAF2900471.1 hypothetical protein ILUMI_05723 [Ignelater luminosus]
MNFKTLTFVFGILIVTTYGKSVSVKDEEDIGSDKTVRINPIIVDTNMKPKPQQEILEDLNRIYGQNPDNRRCQQLALTVAEKQKTNFACFKYKDDHAGTVYYYIDPSAQYIKVEINNDQNIYEETYLLFAIKRYN